MTRDDIVWRLAELSSLAFQERHVIGGSHDQYILDTELLENVDGLKYMLEKQGDSIMLNDLQKAALADIFTCIEESSEEALSVNSRDDNVLHIRDSKVWKLLRRKAAIALQHFGVSPNLSVEEVEALSERL